MAEKTVKVIGNELYHFGIPGQKWYKRRYQNEDGTYTEEGKERRRSGKERFNKTFNRAFAEQTVKQGKDKPNTSRAGAIAKSAGDIAGKASNIVDRYGKTPKKDLSKYSDSDLRNMVTRLNLERQYNDLSYSDIKSGKEKVLDALDTIGDVAAIGVSAAMIISMIQQIRGK